MRWPNGSQTRPNVASPFGPRPSPTPGASTTHKGCDFTGCNPVRAVADGVVKVVGTPSGWSGGGRQVWIQHDGYFSKSMHMGSFNVSVGQRVSEGDILGAQDTTGTATGSHVHLEITLGNLHYSNVGQIDPVPFIHARLTGSGAVAGAAGTSQLQLDLNTVGYPTTVDGDYGPATKASVSAFQKDYGLTVDGDAGPQTKGKLIEVIKGLQTAFNAIGYTLVVDGYSGPATVGAIKDFQGKNGLTVDGIAGPKTREALNAKTALPNGYNAIPEVRSNVDIQRLVGANPDGIWGPQTTEKVMAWQSAHGLKADGIWGPESDAKGFPKAPAAYIPIAVDGQWGKGTTTALQANLGIISFLPADQIGVLNATTIKALQAAIGIPPAEQDGVIGPKTSKYLQSSLGVAIDGQIGPETIKALQSLLNRDGRLLYVPFKETEEQPVVTYPQPKSATYPGAEKWGHSPNCSVRTGKVQGLIAHHWGTNPIPTPQSTWDRFNRPNDRSVSPNWQINNNGSAWEVVPPDGYRAWTTGQIDHQAVTCEIQNESVTGWTISMAAHERVAQILAWAAKRYNFPIQRGQVGTDAAGNPIWLKPGLVGHNETPAGKATGTTCPGGFNYDWVVARAKEIANPTTEPPVDPEEPSYVELKDAWLKFSAAHKAENTALAALTVEMEKLVGAGA